MFQYQNLLGEERIQLLSDRFHMKDIVKKNTKYGKQVICRVSPTNETTRGFFHDLVLCQDEIDFLDMGSAIKNAKYNEPIKISATCSKKRVIGSQQLQKIFTSYNAPGLKILQGRKNKCIHSSLSSALIYWYDKNRYQYDTFVRDTEIVIKTIVKSNLLNTQLITYIIQTMQRNRWNVVSYPPAKSQQKKNVNWALT